MAEAPAIGTERLTLAPFSRAHLSQRYVGWLNNAQVVRFSEQRHRSHTPETCRNYWRSFDGTPHLFWAIVARDPALGHLGNMTAYLDLENSVAELAIMIGEKSAWGRGFGTEAWIAACRHLLDDRGIRKVTAGTVAANTGMRAIMRTAGMVEDGRRQRHYVVDGEEIDIVYAALFQEAGASVSPLWPDAAVKG